MSLLDQLDLLVGRQGQWMLMLAGHLGSGHNQELRGSTEQGEVLVEQSSRVSYGSISSSLSCLRQSFTFYLCVQYIHFLAYLPSLKVGC